MFLPASTVKAITDLLDATEGALRREMAMKELLLTLGIADVSEAVARRLTDPEFQEKARLELAQFLRDSRNIRQTLANEGSFGLLTPQPPKVN